MDELIECSDGIVVDKTPPMPGTVWIGQTSDDAYQVCTVCIPDKKLELSYKTVPKEVTNPRKQVPLPLTQHTPLPI